MVKGTKGLKEEDEKTLLYELVRNSKKSIDSIATRCGFSRQKTWRLIKELEKKKLIWGYTAVFDEEKIGQKHFVFLAKRKILTRIDDNILDTVILRKLESGAADIGVIVESSFYVHGEADWMLTATAKNIQQARKFSEEIMTLFPGVFEKISILQTMMFVKKNYILNPERSKLKEFF